ncbi:MAG: hypothetical protein LUD50_04695 [Clostridia bacterium]|nr:hypothetical protein [Clostridia bacterium]
MSTWTTPKTDWGVNTDADGNYTGDYFNITDYNRIKNNLEFLGELASEYWPVAVKALPDHTYQEYPYADEINTLADNLESIAAAAGIDAGEKTVYEANGIFIGYADLNRIESACLELYQKLMHIFRQPRVLPFRTGSPYWPFKDPEIPHENQNLRKLRLPFTLHARLGSEYYPWKVPEVYEDHDRDKRLAFRLGSEYFPFKE